MAQRKQPSLGDFLIMAGEAMNNPKEAKRQANRAAKHHAKKFLRELLDKTFDGDEELKRVDHK